MRWKKIRALTCFSIVIYFGVHLWKSAREADRNQEVSQNRREKFASLLTPLRSRVHVSQESYVPQESVLAASLVSADAAADHGWCTAYSTQMTLHIRLQGVALAALVAHKFASWIVHEILGILQRQTSGRPYKLDVRVLERWKSLWRGMFSPTDKMRERYRETRMIMISFVFKSFSCAHFYKNW